MRIAAIGSITKEVAEAMASAGVATIDVKKEHNDGDE
jgi:hypothetical protein